MALAEVRAGRLNLLSADVVTADGRLVTASEDEHDDLLWGEPARGEQQLRVVTSYEFRLHPLGPTVLAELSSIRSTRHPA